MISANIDIFDNISKLFVHIFFSSIERKSICLHLYNKQYLFKYIFFSSVGHSINYEKSVQKEENDMAVGTVSSLPFSQNKCKW